ncbi:MAG TPA: amino acid adenylation domain-containing protein, partial [Ktedonobacteraceae bacterium]|nr:amino acid adenylation domain-containing protein [Ktedonobacteraceae bacterium]
PSERLAFMIEDAAPSFVLVHERLMAKLPDGNAKMIALDVIWPLIGRQERHSPSLRPLGLSASNLAYIIYTSGSTGEPKGVMVEHRNVVRLFAATESLFSFNERDIWTLFHSAAFDFSVWEMWGALLYGGRLVIVPHMTARSPEGFYRLLSQNRVTVLNQTPSAFSRLIEAQGRCPGVQHALRMVILGGEALEFRTLRPWVERNGVNQPQLVNMYGITETTVHVTYRRLSREDIESEGGSLIGRSIQDLCTYVLDHHARPIPIGVVGELYVGGAGVARGYLNRPDLTAERFVLNPFSADPKARMYKTGDLGRWRADGTIEYLGRRDQQVKIRGFRIELGEIEAQLARHPEVKEAVVVVREEGQGEKRLVGYVIGKDVSSPPSAESLREHLKGMLPEYMVPSAFVQLQAFPLTPNGKLDRRGLPAPDLSSYASRQYEPPQGKVEEMLAGIWQELLKVERVGRHDNFFELGGHSLLATRAIVRINSMTMLDMGVRTIFELPTISELANYVAEREREQPMSALMGEDNVQRIIQQVAALPEAEIQRLRQELRIG